MHLEEAVDAIEARRSLQERNERLHGIVQDHGFASFGFVDIGNPEVDKLGWRHSASCVLYWKDRQSLFYRVPRRSRAELHVIMIYSIQRVTEVMTLELGRR